MTKTFVSDLRVGDVIPGAGVVNAMDWYDTDRVTITRQIAPRSGAFLCRFVAGNWDGSMLIADMASMVEA
ncbi:hypothetical protein UFOVP469_20 [uncultured Caudovirales phage]|uniref:Uncharacterized protein n=1 Tax=uncultured Caudovirales phage TaxID=2100421 RepID=A0A6J5R9X7_9CAUD|nr:hypothetical protein UFOVP469_20 [uncultured Caudovirales phage]CAB4190281.1 hypothetical protein UFOVP1200_50 [uncultured Caudovirales phage]